MRSRAGLCRPYEKIIELNPHLLTEPRHLEEVFLHEICHMAVGVRWPTAQSHGRKWANLMRLCGLEPNRCHSLKPLHQRFHRRWELKCSCRVHRVTTVTYNRIKRGVKYRCLTCRQILS